MSKFTLETEMVWDVEDAGLRLGDATDYTRCLSFAAAAGVGVTTPWRMIDGERWQKVEVQVSLGAWDEDDYRDVALRWPDGVETFFRQDGRV